MVRLLHLIEVLGLAAVDVNRLILLDVEYFLDMEIVGLVFQPRPMLELHLHFLDLLMFGCLRRVTYAELHAIQQGFVIF